MSFLLLFEPIVFIIVNIISIKFIIIVNINKKINIIVIILFILTFLNHDIIKQLKKSKNNNTDIIIDLKFNFIDTFVISKHSIIN
jgi:hypothetical protein